MSIHSVTLGTGSTPSTTSGWSLITASGRSRPPRTSSVCSTASWVVTIASPAAVAIAAGPPPS